MNWCALVAALGLGLFGSVTSAMAAEESDVVELAAPQWTRADGEVQLQVTIKAASKGARLVVMTEKGEILGAVTNFGQLPGQPSIPATLAVPSAAICDGRLRLKLQFIEQGSEPRPVRPGEVDLKILSAPRAE